MWAKTNVVYCMYALHVVTDKQKWPENTFKMNSYERVSIVFPFFRKWNVGSSYLDRYDKRMYLYVDKRVYFCLAASTARWAIMKYECTFTAYEIYIVQLLWPNEWMNVSNIKIVLKGTFRRQFTSMYLTQLHCCRVWFIKFCLFSF